MASVSGNLSVAEAFSIWFKNRIPPQEFWADALEGISRFYRRKDEPAPEDSSGGTEEPAIGWDFAVDADIIYADFMRVYGIDLETAELHWWRFMALLEGLYAPTFRERVGFRIGDISGLSSKQRAQAIRLRNAYAIYHEDGGGSGSVDDHLEFLQSIIDKHKQQQEVV